jgi:hypothetical protein
VSGKSICIELQGIANRSVRCRLERMSLLAESGVRKATAEFMAHYYSERNRQGLDNALICPEPEHAARKAKCIGGNVSAGC